MQIGRTYIFLLVVGLVLSSGIIGFDLLDETDPRTELSQAYTEIEKAYERDSIRLIRALSQVDKSYGQLAASPFYITVRDARDSLLFYSDKYALNGGSAVSHWVHIFEFEGQKIRFFLDLFDGPMFSYNDLGISPFKLKYNYTYQEGSPLVFPFELSPIPLAVSGQSSLSQGFPWWISAWFISLLFIGLFVVECYRRSFLFPKGIQGWLIYSVVTLLIGIGAGHYATNHLFGSNELAIVYSIELLPVSLLTVLSILLYSYLLVEGLNSEGFLRFWKKWPVFPRFFIGSLLSNFLIFFVIFISEKLILNGGIALNIEEVLNLSSRTIVYILLLMAFCMVYYYLTALVYKTEEGQESAVWYRIAGHTLGLIFIAVSFLFLGLQIPVIPLVLFLIAYFLLQDLYAEFNARNLTYIIINVILFSAFLSVVLFYSALKKDKMDRRQEMEKVFAVLSPEERSQLMTIRDTLIQSNLIPSISSLTYPSPMDRNELMAYINQIIQTAANPSGLVELAGVECYDQSGNSLFYNHISNFQSNNTTIVNSTRVADNVYHLPINSLSILYFQIENTDFPNGPINLILKFSKPGQQGRDLKGRNYLVYKNDHLIYSYSKDFVDVSDIDPSFIKEDVDIGELSYVVFKPNDQYKIIDYHEVAGLIKPISFFSLIFILFGVLIVGLTFVNSHIQFLPPEISFSFYNQSSLRSKIQLSVILLIIFSFVVIGVITTIYFKNIVSDNDQSKFKTELRTIINDVQNKLTETIDSESAANIIAQDFSELENIYSRNFGYYNEDGNLVIKSESYQQVFQQLPIAILSEYKNAEETGSLKSVSQQLDDGQVLIPIYLTRNHPIGYLSMEYENDRSISSGIFNHLGNLLNVYIFLFFLAGALSIFIANSITEPLAKLREGVKKFKLGRKNEILEYDSSDELGVLIQEYNTMTRELEKSAQIIAKTERDMAWREMAKQVAHEIKNPLTPMKLHLQHLENTIKTSPEKAQEMIKKVSTTLIEQINNLSNIASEFSNYASLPKADNEKTLLNEVVEHVHDLFREREDMDITMNEPIEDLIVFADRNHLVRIVVNIIKNAIQSIPQGRRGKIVINLSRAEDRAVISVRDNGAGIPDAMKDKIFTPNFTTKSSGTGLGLAICVNMLETMNGIIHFESTENEGTEFFIEIPIMRSETPEGSLWLEEL